MHGDHGARPSGEEASHFRGIDVARAIYVGEDRLRAAQQEGIRRRGDGVGGHDHFVAGADPEKDRGHLQSVGRGGDEQRGPVQHSLEQFLAASTEPAATARRRIEDFYDPGQFAARPYRSREGNVSVWFRLCHDRNKQE